jgi:hypothetical protein
MFRLASGLAGQFGLFDLLAMHLFEEVGVDLVSDAAVCFRHRPDYPGWPWSLRRCAGRRVAPEPDVHEDLADGVAGLKYPERALK